MAAEERNEEMSKSKVWTDQNAGTAQGGNVEPNKENKEIAQSERLAPWKAYAAWIAASEAAGTLSGWLSRDGMEFYKAAVLKPPLSPPSVVFPIAWTVLYGLMGIGAARFIWEQIPESGAGDCGCFGCSWASISAGVRCFLICAGTASR